jgi:multiple sugar transport system substrate-binding protein
MRRSIAVWCAGFGAVATLAACSSSTSSTANTDNGNAPVTLTVWSGFTGRELGIFTKALNRFHASHPNVTIRSVGGVDDDKIIKSIRAGNAPDVALSFSTDSLGSYCGTGAWIDLGPYIDRDHVDLNQFPTPVQNYSTFGKTRCSLPMLADTYGLYYNKDLLAKAGYDAPPKTASELVTMAKKLTTYNSDGSIKVAGFAPLWGFYEMVPAHVAPNWNAQWTDADGKSTLGSDPDWANMLDWQKQFVDAIGYDKLKRFTAGVNASEFSASNYFETGKLAMAIDGEYRVAFIRAEHPELKFGTAPFPVDDNQPDLYGSGYVVGNILGIPRNGKHTDTAWQLVKFMATDSATLAYLSNNLKNVPTTKSSLDDPSLTKDPQFATFLKVYNDPNTATTPITAAGSANQDLFGQLVDKWQAGQVDDLHDALGKVDKQIDAQLEQSTGGGAP